MKRASIGSAEAAPAGNEHFTGAVRMKMLADVDAPKGAAALVTFEAGARTHWHSHPNGQFLYVVEGEGRTGTRDGVVGPLRPGDLIYAAPGEQHWHGGTPERGVSHLALSFGDTEWFEEVESAEPRRQDG